MPHLAVSLLGAFEVVLDGKPVTGFKTDKARALLAYLTVERDRPHRRQSLVGLLWPGYPEKDARNNLRVALANLRQVIKEAESHTPFIVVEGETLQFNPHSDFSLDIEELENGAAPSLSEGKPDKKVLDSFQIALDHYRGGFLEGFSLKDSPEFDNWTYVLRERYQGMASTLLGKLADAYEARLDFEKAAEYARRRLELEPWQEAAHRQLMRLLALRGLRPEALAQYEACRKSLDEAFGVEPSAETNKLYTSLRDGEFPVTEPDRNSQQNLPAQLTSFIGREIEIAEIKTLFGRGASHAPSHNQPVVLRRLVTLTGPGGSGKTRLAIQFGRESLELFPDGVWLVELAPLSDADRLVQAVGRVLGMRLEVDPQAQTMLEEYLQTKDLLLILDNCEHLIDACSRLADALLRACPHLRLLATSREALAIEGEASYPVSPLALPAEGVPLSLEQLEGFASVRLFVERAANASPAFALTQQNASAVARICRRLDGLPLALELAARRVKLLRVEEIAGLLDDRFRLLTGGSRAALPRYQTLRASVDWSYELLSPAEQGLLGCLSVFAGGWTLEAAQFTGCGEKISSSAVLDLLGSLVNKSMLEVVAATAPATRYRMLETLRQYAHEKLVEAGGAAAARNRVLAYYVDLAERLEGKIRGPDQGIIMDLLEAELDNLRQVLEWSLEIGNPDPGLRIASALLWFWHARGWHAEGLHWHARLLSSQSQAATSHPLSPDWRLVRAKALQSAGFLEFTSLSKATIFLKEGVSLCQELGPDGKRFYAYILRTLGVLSVGLVDRSRVNSLAEESLAIFLEVGDRFGYCESTELLAMQALLEHDFEKAQSLIEQSLAVRKEIGDQDGISWELILLGCVALGRHDFEKARSFIEDSLLIASRIKCVKNFDFALLHLGLIAWLQGKYEQAALDFEKLLSESRRQGVFIYIAIGYSALGRLALSQDEFEHATRLLEENLAFARNKKPNTIMIYSLCDLGVLALAKGEIEFAAQVFLQARELNQDARDKTVEVNVFYGLGKVDFARRSFSSAYENFIVAIEQRPGYEWPFTDWSAWNAALPLEALALLAVARQQVEVAARLLGATEDYHQGYRYTRSPRERSDRATAIETTQKTLGEASFMRAWNEGLAMTLEQAIACAKQELATS